MRRLLLSILVLGTALAARAEAPWTDLPPRAALAKAKTQGKPVLIDFFAVWCGPCKEMDKKVYPDPAVRAFMSGFVNIKVDAEKGEGLKLAKEHKVFNYPTVVLLDAHGKEIDRMLGSMPPEDFIKTAQGFLDGKGTLRDFLARFEKSPDDMELALEIGDKYSQYQDVEAANRYLGRVIRREMKTNPARAEQAMLSLADVYRRTDRHAENAEVLEDFRLLFPDSKRDSSAVSQLAKAYSKGGRKEKAAELYTAWLDKKGRTDKNALNAYAWFFAKQGFNLDAAIEAAGQAAEISKRDPAVLDTLAEAQYAAGRYDDAIAVMQECVEKDPADTYFKEQLQKFKDAKVKAGSKPPAKAERPIEQAEGGGKPAARAATP